MFDNIIEPTKKNKQIYEKIRKDKEKEKAKDKEKEK